MALATLRMIFWYEVILQNCVWTIIQCLKFSWTEVRCCAVCVCLPLCPCGADVNNKQKNGTTHRGKKVIAVDWNLLPSGLERHSASYLVDSCPPGPIKTKSKASFGVNGPIMRKDNSSSSVNGPISQCTCTSCVHFFNQTEAHLLILGESLSHSQLINQLLNAVGGTERVQTENI